jgi:hypothetical protein
MADCLRIAIFDPLRIVVFHVGRARPSRDHCRDARRASAPAEVGQFAGFAASGSRRSGEDSAQVSQRRSSAIVQSRSDASP